MPSLPVLLDGPEDFTPIPQGAKWHHVPDGLEVALLIEGTVSGKPSVMLRVELPNGEIAIVETTWALFDMAHAAMRGRLDLVAELETKTKGSS